MSVSPGSGVSQVSTFTFQAAATDPDGDAVTLRWDFGDGTTATGASQSKTMTGDGPVTVKVTATDPSGASGSDTRVVTVGTMAGSWHVDIPSFVPLQLTLQQSGGTVTGSFEQLEDLFVTPKGTIGKTDPAEPGTVDADGKFSIRFKVAHFLDFYLRGQLDSTGHRFTGGIFNSGFSGQEITGVKQ